ncbi:unnamed protein product, partial [Aphanomyces euteiches]
ELKAFVNSSSLIETWERALSCCKRMFRSLVGHLATIEGRILSMSPMEPAGRLALLRFAGQCLQCILAELPHSRTLPL